ncbi:hypothetical protein FNV43_RR19206 [Rhamnella rubrinervis]|uniref:ENTH domain-containing protein n=1 Tax=Rhamnella rubrinervis TaxID=2594499 RepID=A0A8K0GY75_9ROSA|nr:hypothetical protein FNV43_RR19206 [Rhamnella rubrinervis]
MGVDIQGKLRLALGSVKDHASIGKAMIYNHHDGFSDIEIAVLRATGHDNGPIDDKYMHEILFLVSNYPGSIPFLAERISRRLGKTKDRLVALKTLVLIHRLLRGGNRCFEQQLRGAHVSGHLQMSSRWFSRIYSDPSVCFLHKYSSYLEERMGWIINQAGKLDPVVSQGLELRCYEEKYIDMVFRTLPKCQVFIDKVLDCSPFDILPSDYLAQAAMTNILKESFQVYVTFCEGIAALVNMFFDLTRPARGLACEILKRASHETQGLHDLYENCKQIIENKNLEYPSVQIITMDQVMAWEQCFSCAKDHQLISCTGASVLSRTAFRPPYFLDFLTKSNELQMTKMSMEGKKKEQKSDVSLSSSTLFSWSLETKISKVWVVFEDDDPNQLSGHPAETLPRP